MSLVPRKSVTTLEDTRSMRGRPRRVRSASGTAGVEYELCIGRFVAKLRPEIDIITPGFGYP